MKKRLICLALGLLMLLGTVLASCSNENNSTAAGNISDSASELSETLTMWVVSEKPVGDEDAALVSDAINAITKSKLRTQVVMKFLTRDVYEAELEKTILAYEAAKKSEVKEEETSAEEESTTARVEETMTNEWGLTVTKFPTPLENQVDIIYINGETMFSEYVEKGWLAELDTELGSSSKKLKEYVSPTLLSAVKTNNKTYAIPNNNVIGEYTYMLLDKDLVDKMAWQGYLQQGQIDGFYSDLVYDFLDSVQRFYGDEYTPIDSDYDYCLDLLAHYWSVSPEDYSALEEFSVFGSLYTNAEDLTRGSVILGFDSLFSDAQFASDFLKLNYFDLNNYFKTEGDTKPAALKFVTGDASTLKKNNAVILQPGDSYTNYADKDYYAVVVKYPTASTEDIYGNMFGVCSYTKSLSRSMQVITYLNTNADLRNLLQYGVEGTHYWTVVNDEGEVTGITRKGNEAYLMDIGATGNAFIAYPEENMSSDIWTNGKEQNRGSLVSPLLGFDIKNFAESAVDNTTSEKLDSEKGYNLSYTTGYSVDVLSQDAVLANWLNGCTEKDVHVLMTSETSGLYTTYNIYVYNNNLSNNVSFDVEVFQDFAITTNKKGQEVKTQTDLDFILKYKKTTLLSTTGSKNGYELSLVRIYTKKNNNFEIKTGELAKLEECKDVRLTQLKELITFDFYNTDQYKINVDNILMTNILDNDVIYNWVTGTDTRNGQLNIQNPYKENKEKKAMLAYKEVGETTTRYTYVFFRYGMSYPTELTIQPTGVKNKLMLNFLFTRDTSENALKIDAEDPNYMLYYITIEADNNVAVELSYFMNITTNPESETAPKITNASAAPDYSLVGNLNTELVKYMYKLNSDVNDIIAQCKADIRNGISTYADFEQLVADLQVLLSTSGNYAVTSGDFKGKYLLAYAKNADGVLAGTGAFSTLHKNLLAYTTYEITGEPDKWSTISGGNTPEDMVQYDSPYGIYYQWLEKYGYLPTK